MGASEVRLGEVVAGSYRLVRVLGEGGMGTVYEAQHLRLDRRFALKILKPEVAQNAEMFGRFRREAEIASSSHHENVIEVFDFNVLGDGAPYIVMEYLEGETLGDRIQRRGRLRVDEVASFLDQAASALQATHERGVVHRDLKPQNIYVVSRGKRDDFVKILDFGISKVLHDAGLTTQTGALLGTPNYMAPEQLTGTGDIDRRADVWALGAIAYECFTGARAFSGPTIPGTLYAVCHAEPRPISEFTADVPRSVVEVIGRALKKSRDERFATADEMRRAFLAACGRIPSSPPPGPTAKGLPPMPAEARIVVKALEAGDVSAPTMADVNARPSTPPTLGTSSREIAISPKKPGFRGWVVGGVVAAIGVVVGLVLLRDGGAHPTTVTTSTTVTTTTSASPNAQVTVAATPAASVEVHVRTDPSTATILLDGAPITPPVHIARDAAARHSIVVRDDGFVDVTREIAADADTDLFIRLEKQPAVAVASNVSPPKKSTSVVTSKPTTSPTPSPPPTSAPTASAAKIDIKGPLEKEL